MKIETNNLIIRPIQRGDETEFACMAEDGSLQNIGFGPDSTEWIGDWIEEALSLRQTIRKRTISPAQYV